MKLFSSKKKIAIIGTMLTTMLAGTIAYAATPIKQDAYYDTFKLVVNGTEQFISDTALKPFIANSRVYVPIATLQNLGIANVQWTPAASGQVASLAVSPKSTGMDASQMAAFQQQISILTTNLNSKETENTNLIKQNTELKEELAKLKSSSSSSSGSSTLSSSKIKDLESYYYNRLYRNSFRQTYKDGDNTKTLDLSFDATVSTYRDELDIELVSDRNFSQTAWDLSVKKDSYEFERYLQREVIDEALAQFKDVRDLKINVTVYSTDKRSGSRIAMGTYDRSRFTLSVY